MELLISYDVFFQPAAYEAMETYGVVLLWVVSSDDHETNLKLTFHTKQPQTELPPLLTSILGTEVSTDLAGGLATGAAAPAGLAVAGWACLSPYQDPHPNNVPPKG